MTKCRLTWIRGNLDLNFLATTYRAVAARLAISTVLFILSVGVAHSQVFYITHFGCNGFASQTDPCVRTAHNGEARIDFVIEWDFFLHHQFNVFNRTTCGNFAPVTNAVEVGTTGPPSYEIGYGVATSLSGGGYVMTASGLGTALFFPNGSFTDFTETYYPENCRSLPGGGGGCGGALKPVGDVVGDEKISKLSGDISPLSCTTCNPEPWELDACWISGFQYDWASCFCGASPIVIDVLGNGINLTNADNGVVFDLNGDGITEQISWTSSGSEDAWLVLDRNGNGVVDDGKELFGDNTPQPVPTGDVKKNGFLALAVFDKPENGGDSNGKISQADAIFTSLRLWQDANHNGISEANELQSMADVGLKSIDLDYQQSRRHDEHGNAFRYRAKVRDTQDAQLGRWAWDVYLIKQTPAQ